MPTRDQPHTTGTVHGRFVRAPQISSGTAVASRKPSGTGKVGLGGFAAVKLLAAKPRYSNHHSGEIAKEVANTRTVAAAPMAAARHSPRRTCHHQPTAVVTFVINSI